MRGSVFVKPFEFAIISLHGQLGEGSYGVAIIAFKLVLKALTFPLNKQQIESTSKMQAIQPAKELQDKYSTLQDKYSKLQDDHLSLHKDYKKLAGEYTQAVDLYKDTSKTFRKKLNAYRRSNGETVSDDSDDWEDAEGERASKISRVA